MDKIVPSAQIHHTTKANENKWIFGDKGFDIRASLTVREPIVASSARTTFCTV